MKNPLFLTGFWTLLDCAGLDSGGDEGDRTPGLGVANAALSQLSYIPGLAKKRAEHIHKFAQVSRISCVEEGSADAPTLPLLCVAAGRRCGARTPSLQAVSFSKLFLTKPRPFPYTRSRAGEYRKRRTDGK